MKKIAVIFGTRPEAIKLAPFIAELRKYPKRFIVKVCSTGQHAELLEQVVDFFNIKIDHDMKVMTQGQTLFELTSKILLGLELFYDRFKPDLVFIQGDTTTAFIGALTAFYKSIPVAHIEAGLRTGDKYSPFPEESNRILTSHLAKYHFAPTKQAINNLKKEGIKSNIFLVGNTVIDALFLGLEIIKATGESKFYKYFNQVDFSKDILLVTAHRRENFGKPFVSICRALLELASKYKNTQIVYPVHLNPNVRKPVYSMLSEHKNIVLLEPLNYPIFIWLASKAHLIITDSGGVQEEAPSLGKPLVVIRDTTERTEGVKSGTAVLTGTSTKRIVKAVSKLIEDEKAYSRMARTRNPYGDGKASKRIVKIIFG